MLRRLVKDESGMTMGLTVITMVLIGVMGAGLLVFVGRDLNSVVENNQGQRAFELAEAGAQLAEEQLKDDSSIRHYDGGTGDIRWSKLYSGGAGMTFTNLDNSPSTTDSVHVEIEYRYDATQSVDSFVVVSTGTYGDARRKVEAVFHTEPALSIPNAYLAWGNLTLTGNASPQGVSLFTLRNASRGGSATLGTLPDKYFGKWAETSGAGPYPNALGSYPNDFNRTARGSDLGGLGARGTVTGSAAFAGTRSYGSNTTPVVVPDYDASILAPAQKIAFPFEVANLSRDREEIDVLRERALLLEQASPGTPYYIDSIPGNGQDNAGLSTGARTITSWPSGSTYSTVVFYKFATYNTNNNISYNPPSAQSPCGAEGSPAPTGAARGVIVVENGDVVWDGNRGFYGAVITRPYDASGNLVTTTSQNFYVDGNTCLRGYANAGGEIYLAGNLDFGSVPELGSLGPFKGDTVKVSWRELYQ
jgi:hypothetical protein